MVFRINPHLGPEAYKTYAIRAPRSTHQRKATCAEYGCTQYERGWVTRIDESTELGKNQAAYIRSASGRKFTETHEDGFTNFVFYPGQRCFREHYVSLDREPQFLVLGGDYRGNPRGDKPIMHRNFDDWANDFGDHQNDLWKAQNS